MSPTKYAVALSVGFAIVIVACSGRTAGPSGPSALTAAPGDGTQSRLTHAQILTAVLGSGSGIVNVTATAAVDGFSAQITVNVHGAPPDTTFYVQRAPEIGRANGADGICQRAVGAAPWGPPTANFLTFSLPTGPVTLTTSEGGAGAAHIDFTASTIPDDTRFDVMFRLVDDLSAPTNELRTGCFTVTVR
jgi:hypothetical protein